MYAAAYNGDNLLVSMQDTAGGSFPTQHEYTWGLGGLLYDLCQNAVYTPGVSQNVAGTDSFFHTDWLGSTRYLSDSTGNSFRSVLRHRVPGNGNVSMQRITLELPASLAQELARLAAEQQKSIEQIAVEQLESVVEPAAESLREQHERLVQECGSFAPARQEPKWPQPAMTDSQLRELAATFGAAGPLTTIIIAARGPRWQSSLHGSSVADARSPSGHAEAVGAQAPSAACDNGPEEESLSRPETYGAPDTSMG